MSQLYVCTVCGEEYAAAGMCENCQIDLVPARDEDELADYGLGMTDEDEEEKDDEESDGDDEDLDDDDLEPEDDDLLDDDEEEEEEKEEDGLGLHEEVAGKNEEDDEY